MSHSRDDSLRRDVDRLSPTVPIRPAQPRPQGDATNPLPGLSSSKSVNRITPHLPHVPSTPIVNPSSLFRRGQRVGDYEIVEELARGGMGVIYKAQQTGLNRTVALKMVLRGDFAHFEELVRFRTEAQAIARLHHPNLVSIFEIGDHDGLPFYAMEFLEGGTLARRIEKKRMLPRAAAKLMLPLAQAIEYAHSRGIIHRDLKPSNILFVSATASIEKNIPKITDFGVAKHVGDDSGLTRTGDILGTPSYMAPEQATGRSGAVGPAADVYSLGAILYELLTGRAPFVGVDPADTLLQMLNNEPAPLRKINRKVPVDLETICLKCLEKDPEKRYASAALLAEDLRRFLADEPILARPVPPHERLRKWVRRSPVLSTVIVASVLLAVVGLGSLAVVLNQSLARMRAEDTADKAQRAADKAQLEVLRAEQGRIHEVQSLLADALLERGIALAEKNDVRRGLHWMIRSLEEAEKVADRKPEAAAVAEAVRYNLAHWGNLAAPPEKLLPHDNWAWAVAFTPDGKTAITGGRDNRLRAWDAQTGEPRGKPMVFPGAVWSIAVHPEGYVFAAGGSGRGEICSYRILPDGELERVAAPVHAPLPVKSLTLSPDGRFLLARLFGRQNSAYGEAVLCAVDLAAAAPLAIHDRLPDSYRAGEFAADSSKIYFAGPSEIVTYHVTGKRFMHPTLASDPEHEITAIGMTPDRSMLAISVFDKKNQASGIDLWRVGDDPENRKRVFHVLGSAKVMVFSPDARTLAISTMQYGVGNKDVYGQVHVAEVHNVDESNQTRTHNLYEPVKHARPVWALAFHPSGRYYATGGEDGTSRLWDVATGQPISQPLQHEGTVSNLAISPQGTHLLTASAGGDPAANARLSELPAFGHLPVNLPGKRIHAIAWDKTGRQFVAQDQDFQLSRWDAQTRTKIEDVPRLQKIHHPGMYFSSCGLIRENDTDLRRFTLYDAWTNRKISVVPDFDLHPGDGSSYAFIDHIPFYNRAAKKLCMYRVADGTLRGSADFPEPPTDLFPHLPSGRHGAIVNRENGQGSEVRVFDLDMNQLAAWTLPNRSQSGYFNASGNIIAVRGDYQFRFFDALSGKQVYKAISHDLRVRACEFHPKADLLLFSSPTGQIHCRHIASGKPIGKQPDLHGFPFFISPKPDGTSYVAGGRDLHLIEWPYISPKTEPAAQLKTWVENLTGMTLDTNDELTPIEPATLMARRQAAR